MTWMQLAPGTVFANDFQVVRPLGQGGMGAVYVVHQLSTKAQRALKLMRPELLQDARLRDRFHQEATVGASIGSEHVVKVIAAGIDPASGWPFLVMELLEGEGLEELVMRRGAIPWNEAHLLLAQLCHGLAAAHAQAVVHRDLKPENVFVARSHRADVPFTVKILDFGIAKVVAEAMGTSRAATQSLGSPLYMAPEQANPRSIVSPATDVWSLSLLAFYMLTGRSYWLSANVETASLQSLLAEILQAPMAPASYRLAELGGAEGLLPQGFDAWFAAGTQRDPAMRYPNAGAAFQALTSVLGARVIETVAAAPPLAHLAAPQRGTMPSGHQGGGEQPATQPWGSGDGLTVAAHVGPSGTQVGTGSLPAETQAATVRGGPDPAVGQTVQAAPAGLATGPSGLSRTTGDRPTKSRLGLVLALTAGFAGVVVLAAGGLGYGLWARERVVYCAEVIEPWSEPQCDRPVPESDLAHRARTFRIKRAKGHVREVVLVNNAGQPANDPRGFSRWTFTYEAGRVKERAVHAQDGRILSISRMSKAHDRIELLGPNGKPRPAPETEVFVEEHELDARGLVTRERYYSIKGSPVAGRDGSFGYTFVYDERGRRLEQVSLGPDGNPAFDNRHVQVTRRKYNDVGDQIGESYATIDGKPQSNADGCYGYAYELDKVGNATKVTCQDETGQPRLGAKGTAGWSAQFDARGNQIDVRFQDAQGHPAYEAGGVAGVKYRHDDRGNPIETRFFGVDGRPLLNAGGVAGYNHTYDEADRVTATAYVGLDGNPTFNSDDVAGLRKKYDPKGNVIELTYIDVQGQPMLNSEGYATERRKVDDNDDIVERSYFDVAGNPIASDAGYASVRYVLDATGHVVKESYFAINGTPTLASNWASAVTHAFDDRGNELETTYLGIDGQRTFCNRGYAIIRRAFNDRGVVVEESYFDPEAKPTWSRDGAGMKRTKVDAFGRTIEESTHDPDGRLIPDSRGVASERMEYDPFGRVVTLSYFDAFGRPVRNKSTGYAMRKARYDRLGNASEHAYFDEQSKPVAVQGKAAIVRYEYDERGHSTAESTFDVDGKPVAGSSNVAIERTKRDAKGNITEWAFFDVDGKPVRSAEGYILIRTRLDAMGRQIEWRYFDAEGKPVKLSSGYAASFASYDERGRRAKVWYEDEAGQPATLGRANSTRYEYDARGNRTLEVFQDASGNAVENQNGFAQVRSTYDERGILVERAYLDAAGKPASRMLSLRQTIDRRGDVIESRLFDAEGKPATNSNGISVERVKRDGRGRAIERSYFQTDDKPAIHRAEGGATLRFKYDELGTVREKEVLDATGRMLKTLRYDTEGKPVK